MSPTPKIKNRPRPRGMIRAGEKFGPGRHIEISDIPQQTTKKTTPYYGLRSDQKNKVIKKANKALIKNLEFLVKRDQAKIPPASQFVTVGIEGEDIQFQRVIYRNRKGHEVPFRAGQYLKAEITYTKKVLATAGPYAGTDVDKESRSLRYSDKEFKFVKRKRPLSRSDVLKRILRRLEKRLIPYEVRIENGYIKIRYLKRVASITVAGRWDT